MSDSERKPHPEAGPEARQEAGGKASPDLDRGTYEVIRDRLLSQAKGLRQRAEALNARRLELFGATELTVVGSERIRTEHNCVPRDLASVGDLLVFGYNVFFGLKTETAVSDVFSLYRFRKNGGGGGGDERGTFDLEPVALGKGNTFLDDPTFVREFKELYQYYKSAKLLQLRRVEDKLLAVFQAGAALDDVKVFRWRVSPEGVSYIDNRGERDHQFPPSHDFTWTPTGRDDFVPGRHPHVSILDEVFVETVGGDLTVKVEDNTEDGRGIYREPVEDADQSLDDGEIHYAKVGVLILLKILPYREKTWRYLVYNTRTRTVQRIDAIGQSCVQLPEDHGIIFPGGFYLQSGESRTFDADVEHLEYKRALRSPNGEDVLYLFHHREAGRTVMLPYNVIRKEVANPIECHGFTFFDDGKLVLFRALSEEPKRVHPLQIWQTPITSDEHAAQAPTTGSYLEKVGNSDLVRGISDVLSLCRAIEEQEPSRPVYEDLIAAIQRTLDSYYWLGHDEVGDLLSPVQEAQETAELIVDEFEKVEALRQRAAKAVEEAEADLEEVVKSLRPDDWEDVTPFVDALSALRRQRGHLITLKDLRYVDRERLEALEARAVEHFDAVSARAVTFLDGEAAFAPYHRQLGELEKRIAKVEKVSDAEPLRQETEKLAEGLDLLAEVVSGLAIDDATVRTRILEGISEVLGGLNRVRALLENRRKELGSKEAVAEFAVQFQLFGQSVTGALALADTPEACDEQLAKLLLQLEDLEGRFGEFEDYLEQLATRREDVYEAFSARKQRLLDERQRRADQLQTAADRILEGIERRTAGLASDDELNTYFASDPMVERLRDLARRLRDLGQAVRADEIDSRLKSARQDAGRALRDRKDLYEDGAEVIKLGRHRFSVNTQEPDLTLLPRGDHLELHLTGTDFHEPLAEGELADTEEYWDQLLVSETPRVYRGEYLAAEILAAAEEGRGGLSLPRLQEAAATEGGLLKLVRQAAGERYDEGYERGLHDVDAAAILEDLLSLYSGAGLLRFPPAARAAAALFWARLEDRDGRARWARRAASLSRLRRTFSSSSEIEPFAAELAAAVAAHSESLGLELAPEDARAAGRYLFEELGAENVRLVLSAEAAQLRDRFRKHLDGAGALRDFEEDQRRLQEHPAERYRLVRAWMEGFLLQEEAAVSESSENGNDDGPTSTGSPALDRAILDEATVHELTEGRLDRDVSSALVTAQVENLLGQHPRIRQGSLTLRLDEFLARLGRFRHHRVPGFRRFQKLRHQYLERQRSRLRLSELEPRVMSTFVRNRLIDQVYLPLIGDNLAKQIGALGDGKRTDQMGLLLLVSPPGYGKTTLMEYVAHRLGLVFLKINGPALGHSVRSLDPAEAPNATARREVEKINFGFEMGNNVLLYLDDIQHTHPELLQKFISLCDAQRKVEGVWRGETRTYDLRGKRFAVCMAGNPYTESGETFRIPDMLANRADVYNLGDVLEGKEEAFALSYIENALTSNSVLAPLTTRAQEDVGLLVRMARGEEVQSDQLAHGYGAAELEEILSVLRKLLKVQQVVLRVNEEYIRSAGQEAAFRTEPPFRLQGSYRNMNRLAERIVPVMNDAEVEALLDDHYLGESQTLTGGAEHNLLKLAQLRGRMSEEQEKRWQEIRRSFARVQAMGGGEDDPATRVVGQLGLVADRLGEIGQSVADGARSAAQSQGAPDTAANLEPLLTKLQEGLANLAEASRARPAEGVSQPLKLAEGDAVVEHLGKVSTGLERLGKVVMGAVAEMKATPKAAPKEGDGDSGAVLGRMTEILAALAESPRGGTQVVQTLGPGIHDLLGRLVTHVEDALLPSVRSLGRRIRGSEDKEDRRLGDQLDRTLKSLDQLKELAAALRKIETSDSA